MKKTIILLTTASVLAVGFYLSKATHPDIPVPADYPKPDPYLGEKMQPYEGERAMQIANSIQESLTRQWSDGDFMPRDAHAKAHGCVKALFRVEDDLHPNLAHGVFQPGREYKAWIRFSNSAGNPYGNDYKRDGRGMAIKLTGVDEKGLLPSPEDQGSQDFVMISHPTFFADDPDPYRSFTDIGNSPNIIVEGFRIVMGAIAVGLKGTLTGMEITHLRIANPLEQRYWSMTPYQLGTGDARQAIKFSARACHPVKEPIPDEHGPNYLRTELKKTLDQQSACMEFLVQPRTSDTMSVEDTVTEWTEAEAPFHKVASITIPQQTFDTPEQNQFCENLSYTPWHASEAHKPLGAINRMRREVYQQISKFRHKFNKAKRQEPGPWVSID